AHRQDHCRRGPRQRGLRHEPGTAARQLGHDAGRRRAREEGRLARRHARWRRVRRLQDHRGILRGPRIGDGLKSVEQNLTQYAAYHRDRRNIATHFAGIPMIVFAGILALATIAFPLGIVTLTAAAVLSIALVAYYLVLDRALGMAMAIALFLMCAGAS